MLRGTLERKRSEDHRGPKSTTAGVGNGRKGTEIETEMRQIWNGDAFRRKKRKQKRIMSRQLEEIFFFFFPHSKRANHVKFCREVKEGEN